MCTNNKQVNVLIVYWRRLINSCRLPPLFVPVFVFVLVGENNTA